MFGNKCGIRLLTSVFQEKPAEFAVGFFYQAIVVEGRDREIGEHLLVDRTLDHRIETPAAFANDGRPRRAHAYESADEPFASLGLIWQFPFQDFDPFRLNMHGLQFAPGLNGRVFKQIGF